MIRFDYERGIYHEINNITGERRRICVTGEPIRKYRVGKSGSMRVSERKELAKQVSAVWGADNE